MELEPKDMTKIQLMVQLLISQREHTETAQGAVRICSKWESMYKENNQEKSDMIDKLSKMLDESIKTSQDLIVQVNERDKRIAAYETVNLN
jgi:hypothetical protein